MWEQHEHLKQITGPNVDINQISILIGCDHFNLISPREIHYGPPKTEELFSVRENWSAFSSNMPISNSQKWV